ncbi:MAG: hypothetical protein M3R02_25280 [Chloroflexota bacterium]|nr:hypothetical protein [Chloroflexota bacterium]
MLTFTSKPFNRSTCPRYSSDDADLLLTGWRRPWYGDTVIFDNQGLGIMDQTGSIRRPDEMLEGTDWHGDVHCYSRFGDVIITHGGGIPGWVAPGEMRPSGSNGKTFINGMERTLRQQGFTNVRRY